MVSEAQKKAQRKYDNDNTKQITLKFNLQSDADILEKLQNEENKQGYIKNLIRKSMQNNNDILSINSIKYLILPIVKKYSISSVSVFGSYARNEANPSSDVDLIIDGGKYQGLFEFMKIVDEFKEALQRDVDIVTKEKMDHPKSKSEEIFYETIDKEKIVLI